MTQTPRALPLTTPLTTPGETPNQVAPLLVIGVVNNMPEAAFQATADQFDSLLRQALPHGSDLHLRLFRPPDRNTGDPVSKRHDAAQQLWTATLDGLIVTGAEPQADHIADEPCLPFLAKIVDWADAGALPTIWSCLAAHAAAYRLDGIARRQRDTKLFGAFECDKMQHHPLLDGSCARWTIPHSRQNDLSEAELTRCGYQILTRSVEVGADTFVKQMGASHVFLNGHPEYGQATLRSEYRRDVRRFLLGEQVHYPEMPTGYFSEKAVREQEAFRDMVSGRRAPELMERFPAAAATAMPWRDTAIGLFRNWLHDVARRKADRAAQLDGLIASTPTAVVQRDIAALSGPIAQRFVPGQAQPGCQAL